MVLSIVKEINSLSPEDESFLVKIDELVNRLKALNTYSSNNEYRFNDQFIAYRFHKEDFKDIYLNNYFFLQGEYCWVSNFKNEYCWVAIEREKIRQKLLNDTLFGNSTLNTLMKHGSKLFKNKLGREKYIGLFTLLRSKGFERLCRFYEIEKSFENDVKQGPLFINELNIIADVLERSEQSESLQLEMLVVFTCALLTIFVIFVPSAVLPITLALVAVGIILCIPDLIESFKSRNKLPEREMTLSEKPLLDVSVALEATSLSSKLSLAETKKLSRSSSIFCPVQPANNDSELKRSGSAPSLTSVG